MIKGNPSGCKSKGVHFFFFTFSSSCFTFICFFFLYCFTEFCLCCFTFSPLSNLKYKFAIILFVFLALPLSIFFLCSLLFFFFFRIGQRSQDLVERLSSAFSFFLFSCLPIITIKTVYLFSILGFSVIKTCTFSPFLRFQCSFSLSTSDCSKCLQAS